jgi:hypothetical protein
MRHERKSLHRAFAFSIPGTVAGMPNIGSRRWPATPQPRLAEAHARAWLRDVAAPEESLKHLRQRRAEAESQLSTIAELPS